jgi:transcriptional regulator with XRE-family HTH domain
MKPTAAALATMNIDVGARLKHVRELHGLSQRELARRAGVTNGLISLIEQNRVSPSVGSLKRVLDGVPLSLAEFFTLDLQAQPQVFYDAEELVELGNAAASLRLVAAQRSGRQLTVLHERYQPGAATGEEMLAHRGEEGGVVMRGRIELTVGGQVRVLGPGDAYYFTSSTPHRFRNVGREVCEIISASTPPTF